jgi:Tfp pilus assembly protein PilN
LKCKEFDFEYLDELLDKFFKAVTEESAFFAVEQPKEKDPRRPGTVIAVAMILLTVGLLSLQGAWNACAKESLKKTISLKKELDSEREKYKSQLESVKKNISRTIKTYRLLEEHRRIDDNFIFMLDSLARITPKYTRLNEIHQDDKGGIAINGISYTQRDIAKFAKNLVELSSMRELSVEPEDIQSKSGALEKKFSFKVRKKQ